MGMNSLGKVIRIFPMITYEGTRYTELKYLGQYWVNLGVILREAKALGHAPDNIKVKIAIAYRNLPRVKFGKDFPKSIYASGHRGEDLFTTESPYKVWVPSAVVVRALKELIGAESERIESENAVTVAETSAEADPDEMLRKLLAFEAAYEQKRWAAVTVPSKYVGTLWRMIEENLCAGTYARLFIDGKGNTTQIIVYRDSFFTYVPHVRVALRSWIVIDAANGGSVCLKPLYAA